MQSVLVAVIVLAVLVVAVAISGFVWCRRLTSRLTKLENSLKLEYWTKKTIARMYGEPPLDKMEAEAKQDEILNGGRH